MTWSVLTSEHFGTTVQECPRHPRHAANRPQGCGLSKGSSSTSPSSGSCRVWETIRNNETQWETMRNMSNPSSWWSPCKSCDLGFSCIRSLSVQACWWHKMIRNVRMIGCKILWKQGSCCRCRSWRAVSKLCCWSVIYLELPPMASPTDSAQRQAQCE